MNFGLSGAFFKGFFLIFLIAGICISCTKDAPFGIIQSEIPPPPITVGRDIFVSSLQDTVSFTTVSSSSQDLTYVNFKFNWINILKPDGSPAPVIASPRGYETTIYNMVPGEYQFQVEASNKKGSSKDVVSVIVVKDTLAKKTIYLSDLAWNIIDIPLFPGSTVSKNIIAELQSNLERPDLFFRKPWSMYIDYLNDGEQEWKTMKDFTIKINEFKSITLSRENMSRDWLLMNFKRVTMRISFR
jgi:hypothetical protein